MTDALLEIKDLEIVYQTDEETVHAVNRISLNVNTKETLGLVGETGAGKTTTALAVMRLLPDRIGKVGQGQILFEGENLLDLKESEMLGVRGEKIAMIFQDPMTALNPVFTVGYQINESLLYHDRAKTKSEAKQKAIHLLKDMGIPLPEKRVDEYPYQFSGGMCQRAMIAMAMSCSPKVLIADEPTTALDVTIQAQIFELMEKLKREHDTAIMLITHDMGVVSELADDVAVMYMGSIVERGSVREVLKYPAHPYTAALLRSIPILHKGRGQRLEPIRGSTPDPYDRPKGCQFAPRCDFCCEKCRQEMPPEVPVCDGHAVRCWNAEQVYAGHREEVEAV